MNLKMKSRKCTQTKQMDTHSTNGVKNRNQDLISLCKIIYQ